MRERSGPNGRARLDGRDRGSTTGRNSAPIAAEEVVGARSRKVSTSRHDVPMTDGTEISLRLVARVWATIDAQMDNTVDTAVEDGPDESVRMG